MDLEMDIGVEILWMKVESGYPCFSIKLPNLLDLVERFESPCS